MKGDLEVKNEIEIKNEMEIKNVECKKEDAAGDQPEGSTPSSSDKVVQL